MSGRTIAIGDIHGCADALAALLNAIEPDQDDVIVTLGDYVDRGPNSKGVIDQLLKLDDQCQLVPLLGNHELMMLAAREDRTEYQFWIQFGGKETLESYEGGLDSVPVEHIDFISRCRPYYENDTHFFVHANYEPKTPIDRQPMHVLFWEHMDDPPGPHQSGKIATVGHTPQQDGEILRLGHVQCIDTFCFGGKWLTALEVDSAQVWQADRLGRLRGKGEK